MKNIVILLGMVFGITLLAQDLPPELYNKKLIVKRFYVTFLGKNQPYYDKDSTENLIDNSKISFIYHEDGRYSIYRDDTLDSEGVWSLNSRKDSIYIEQEPGHVTLLDNENLIYRSYSLQFADTSARLDTMYTYLHLVPAPVITSVDDHQHNSAIHLFPNPVKNVLNIEVPASVDQEGTLRMVNAYGQILREESLSAAKDRFLHWDVQSLQKGMYYMQILVDGRKRYAQILMKE